MENGYCDWHLERAIDSSGCDLILWMPMGAK